MLCSIITITYTGGIYQYTVENASKTEAPSLEKRAARLQKAVVERANELRRSACHMDFTPPPGKQVRSLHVIQRILSC